MVLNISFSDKLMMYQIGFLFQATQNFHGAGLASAMSTDLVTAYEGTNLKNLMVTKKWFNIMGQNKWLEHPHLLLTEKKLQKNSSKHDCWGLLSE